MTHPGIIFRPGPTGRRAALSGGPDVWEVVAALNAIRDEDSEVEPDALLAALGGVTGLTSAQVAIALRYYAAFPTEIDDRITLNREVADREEAGPACGPASSGGAGCQLLWTSTLVTADIGWVRPVSIGSKRWSPARKRRMKADM
ncbi:hypothetical protein Asp14428_66180 [Actinoplanes sp. NBRC 14428]|nr:hypothetical protein Asp14428_66180 [Actinoplanes sp. NBRC 14428]